MKKGHALDVVRKGCHAATVVDNILVEVSVRLGTPANYWMKSAERGGVGRHHSLRAVGDTL